MAIRLTVSDMASDYERINRPPSKNVHDRKIWFDKQLELMALLGSNYKKRCEIEIDEILKVAPYAN